MVRNKEVSQYEFLLLSLQLLFLRIPFNYSQSTVAVAVNKGRDSEKRKTKVEIMTDFIKLNDEIPVCVVATVDGLQVLKSQISDSMSYYLTLVVQHLKEVSNNL